MVQRLDLTQDVKDCSGHPSHTSADPTWFPFWEAWQINKGQKVTTYAEGGDDEDDTFVLNESPSTKGTVTAKGSPQFYEGLVLPADFKVTNKAPTYILPTTKSAPTLAGGTGAISHDLTATWDCCGSADSTTKVTPA